LSLEEIVAYAAVDHALPVLLHKNVPFLQN
jgi:hypothetical protein